jgi:trehalose-6-phosphate synthase
MDPEERHNRMVQMRRIVKENNIYRWAGNLITELSEIRVGDNESSIEPSDLLKSSDSTPNLRTVHLSVVPPRTNFGG